MIAEPSGYGILRERVFSVLDNLQILTFYLQVFNNLFFPGLQFRECSFFQFGISPVFGTIITCKSSTKFCGLFDGISLLLSH